MAEGSQEWVAEREARLAELQEEYHPVLDAAREAPQDEGLRNRKAELAAEIVGLRTELRQYRETQALALTDGDAVAQPAPVEAQTGVNE